MNISYIFVPVNLPSLNLLFTSNIQMSLLVVLLFVVLFCFFEVLIPTQVSSLPLLLHWEKSKTPLLELLHIIYGENISRSLDDTSEHNKLVSLTMSAGNNL